MVGVCFAPNAALCWPRQVAFIAALVVLTLPVFVAPPAPLDDANFFRLPLHSFESSLTYDDGLENWLSSGATMALKDRVQIMPPVKQRHGLFWNKKPIKTRHFEVRVNFSATNAAKTASDGVFAMWISPDDFNAVVYNEPAILSASRNWTQALEANGLTYIGNKPDFKGLLVLFVASDQKGEASQDVIALWSDGSRKLSPDDVKKKDLPGVQSQQASWLVNDAFLRVRVSPDGSIVGSLGSEQLFTLPKGTFPQSLEQSYFGFSSWSGSGDAYIMLDVKATEVRNFDFTNAAVEESSDDSSAVNAEWKKVLEEEKRFLTQASQMQAVQRLTKLLKDHVDQTTGLGVTLKSDVAAMESRLDRLGGEFGKVFAETEAFDFKKGTFNTDIVREHIKGIGDILEKDTAAHDSKLAQLSIVAKSLKEKGGVESGEKGKKKVHEVAAQARTLEESAAAGSSQTSILLLLLVFSLAGLGLLFWNRMNYYEKKHYI